MVSIKTRLALAAAVLAVASFAIGFVACGGSGDGGSQEAEVISGIQFVEGLGLHDIDESINNDKEVPADARTRALHGETVVRLTDWPDDLDADAKGLADAFAALAAFIDVDNPDLAQAGQLAKTVHDKYHDFDHKVWDWLQDKAGIKSGSGGDGDHGS